MRQRSPAKEGGNLQGIELVVLGLSPVDGFHVEGMTEGEVDAFVAAEVGQPIPGEYAFGADHEVVEVGFDGTQERIGSAPDVLVKEDRALAVEDAEDHGFSVEIDPTGVRMGVESHACHSWEVGRGS